MAHSLPKEQHDIALLVSGVDITVSLDDPREFVSPINDGLEHT